MNRKPQWCYSNCPMAKRGLGFVPDHLPPNPLIAVWLEAAGSEEAYAGRPLANPKGAGGAFDGMLEELGHTRDEVWIMNTLRCKPPKNVYPIGRTRAEAEEACRHWDPPKLDPTIIICTWHPVEALDRRVPQFRPFIVKALEMAFWFAEKGEFPLVAMGEKAMGIWAPHLKGVKKWERHYWRMGDDTRQGSKVGKG